MSASDPPSAHAPDLAWSPRSADAPFPAQNPNPVLRIAADGVLVYANEASAAILALWGCGVGQEAPETWRATVAQALRSEAPSTAECVVDGRTFQLLVMPFPQAGYVNLYGRDITEHLRSEEALRQGQWRFQALLETTSDFIWEIDARGTYTYCSPQVRTLWGYDPQALLGKTPFDLMTAEDREPAQRWFAEVVGSKAPFRNLQFRSNNAANEIVYLEVSAMPFFDAAGELLGYRGITRDVTERMQAEEQRRLQADILDRVGQAVIASDMEGRVTFWNKAAEEMYGWPREEALGRSITDLTVADASPSQAAELMIQLAEGRAWTGDLLARRKDGSTFPALITNAPVLDGGGRQVGAVGVSMDLTAQKRVEDRLRRIAEQLRSSEQLAYARLREIEDLYRNASVGLCVVDRDLRYLRINERRAEFNGLSVEAHLGKTMRELLPELADQAEPLLRRVVETGEPMRDVEINIALPSQPGVVRNFVEQWLPMLDAQGRVVGINIVAEDVTERVRAAESLRLATENLRSSEEHLRMVLENSLDGINTLDLASGRYLFMNEAQVKLTGFTAEEIVGISTEEAYERTHPEDRETTISQQRRVLAGEYLDKPVEYRWKVKNGEYRWFSDRRKLVRDAQGRPAFLVGISRDITEQKLAQEALRASEERFRYVLENSRDALYRNNLTRGALDYVSPMIETLTGYTVREFMDMGVAEVRKRVHPDDEEAFSAHTEALFESDDPSPAGTAEYRWRCKSGEYRWFSLSNRLVRDAEGRPVAIVGGLRDIHEQKLAQEALERSQRWMHALIDSNIIGVGVAEEGRIVQANDAYLGLAGVSREEMEAGTIDWLAVTPPEYAPRDRHGQRELGETGVCSPYEKEYQRRDGTRVPVFIGAARLDPDPLRWVVFALDITERKRLEQDLRALNETLEQRVSERTTQLRALAARLAQAEEQERRRLAQMLHDTLQQTLAAAMLQLNLAQRHSADNNHSWIDAALHLLGEAIDSSRSLNAELSPAILHDDGLVPALHWLGRRMQTRYGLEVAVEVVEDERLRSIPEDVAELFYHCASELLFNVHKHAGVSQARVELGCTSPDCIRLTVADEGRGLDLSQDGAQGPGRGFGLLSVQERILYAGGQCRIESVPGRGTSVMLSLPLAERAIVDAALDAPLASDRASAWSNAQPKARLLIVDDHAMVRRGLAQVLNGEPDLEVVGEAGDGLAGIEASRGLRPDLVLMDVNMPRMDGIEATRRLAAEFPGLPVIGLSMFDDEEKAALMRQAGAAAYVAKAGPPESLVAAIRECLSRD